MNDAWLAILKQVQAGEITAEEGAQRMAALETALPSPSAVDYSAERAQTGEADGERLTSTESTAPAESTVVDTADPADIPLDIGWWRWAWQILLWVGIGIFVLAAVLMNWAFVTKHLFWFYCSWLPLLFGLLALFLGWWSRTARWLHVRIQSGDGKRVAISMPLPLRLAGWLLSIFGRFIPKMQTPEMSNLPMILNSLADAEGPMTVEVNDNNERVSVYIQ